MCSQIKAALSGCLVIRRWHVGSLAQTSPGPKAAAWINMTAHVTMQRVRLLVSGAGVGVDGGVVVRDHAGASTEQVKRRWKGGGDGHSVAMDTTFDLTWWWDILTKNTPPSTFRARLSVTLAKWQFVFTHWVFRTFIYNWGSLTVHSKILCFLFLVEKLWILCKAIIGLYILICFPRSPWHLNQVLQYEDRQLHRTQCAV